MLSKELTTFYRLVDEMRKLDPEIQGQQIITFLLIAQNDGEITVKDIAERAGIAQSSASRNVRYWSEFDRFEKPGQNMITIKEDPRERRRKLLSLNAKGRKFANDLITIVNGRKA